MYVDNTGNFPVFNRPQICYSWEEVTRQPSLKDGVAINGVANDHFVEIHTWLTQVSID